MSGEQITIVALLAGLVLLAGLYLFELRGGRNAQRWRRIRRQLRRSVRNDRRRQE